MHTVKSHVPPSGEQQIARIRKHPSHPMAHGNANSPAQSAPLRGGDWVSGAWAVLPAVVAFAPLALMVGAAVAASDNPLAAWLSTWTIHGGAAQLITLDVVAQQPSWIAAATAGLLVQIRLSAYSTAMVADWRTAPIGLRLLAGVVLSDAPWALAQSRTSGRRGFYLGAGLTLFFAWPAMVTVGTAVGDVVGGVAAAALVPALVVGCTVVTQLRQRPMLVAAFAAGLSATATVMASAGVAFVTAAAVGIVAGLVADRTRRRDWAAAVPS